MPTRSTLGVRSSHLFIVLALISACGAEQTIPGSALEGTTITLNVRDLGLGFGLDPDETDIESIDAQRGVESFSLCLIGTFDDGSFSCPDPRPLVTRFITKVAAHPASRFALGEPIGTSSSFPRFATSLGSPSQSVVVLDIPLGTVAPGASVQTFDIVREPNPALNSLRVTLDTIVTVRESDTENFSVIEQVPGLFEPIDASGDLQLLVPQPVLGLKLALESPSERPAAAEVVLEYPSDKVSIAGAYDSGVESMVTVREVDPGAPLPAGRAHVRILMVNPNLRDDLRATNLQVVLGPASGGYQPVTQAEFAIVDSSLFDRDGNPTSNSYLLTPIR